MGVGLRATETNEGASSPFVVSGRLLDAYSDLNRFAATLLEQCHIDRQNQAQLYGAALAASMLDHSESIYHLLTGDKGNAVIGGIVRSQFELLGVLIYYFKDPVEAYKNEFHRTRSQVRLVLEHATANPDRAFSVRPDAQLKEIDDKFPELSKTKANPKKAPELLKKLDPNAYAVYQTFCLEAHHNLHAINRRHYFHMPPGSICFDRPSDKLFANFVVGMSSYCVHLLCTSYLSSIRPPDSARVQELTRVYDRIIHEAGRYIK